MSSFQSVQLLCHVLLFATPWTAAHQAFLSFTISRSLLKLMSIESVMLSNHLILCLSLLLLPSVFPPGDLPYLGTQPVSPALAGGFLTTEPAGKFFTEVVRL